MYAFIQCLVGDVIRVKDPKKKVKLFVVKDVQASKFSFSKTLCAHVVSQGREDISFVQSGLPWFVYMVSMEPECHHHTKYNGGLLFPPLYVLMVSQK